MVRCIRLVALFFASVIPGLTVAQGIAWDAPIYDPAARLVDDANGNHYVAGFDSDSSAIYFVVDKFSPNGTLLGHFPMNLGITGPRLKSMVGPIFEGHTIRVLATLEQFHDGSIESYLYTFDTISGNMQAASIKSGISQIDFTGIALGKSTYALIGTREFDGNLVIQRRKLSDNSVVNESSAANVSPGEIVNLSNDDYIANASYVAAGKAFLRVYRVGTSIAAHNAAIGTAVLLNLKLCLSQSKTHAWSSGDVDLGTGSEDVYVRPFTVGANSFGTSRSIKNPDDDFVLAMSPYSSSGVMIVLRNFFQSISSLIAYSTSALVFQKDLPAYADAARVLRDGNGNPVVLGSSLNGTTLTRFRFSDGGILNTANQYAALQRSIYVRSAEVNSAGGVVFLQEEADAIEHRFRLAAWSPAAVSVEGAYTVGGDNAIGTVTLDGVAPTGGATFNLLSNNTNAVVPATLTIPAGQSSQTFTINTKAVAANAKPAINANYQGLIVQTTFDLAAPLIQSITATPQSQYGGMSINATLTLTGKAPTGGKVVTLSSSNPGRVSVQASATVAAGTMSKNILLTTYPTLVNASAVISATTGAVTKTVFVAVLAPVLQSATLMTNTIKGGQTTTMTVTLGSKAPSGYTVTLLSGAQSIVPLPNSYTIAANATSVGIPVHTNTVTSSIDVTLVAYRGPYVKVMTLTVHP